METRFLRTLVMGLVLAGLLAGCATTVARQDVGGLPTAENPEYLFHPLRVATLGAYAGGNILQYVAVEPFYFLMATVPEFVGLSLEEQRYIAERQEAWRQFLSGERGMLK